MKDFATLFELTPDLVCLVSKEGMLQKINPSVSQTLQFSEETLFSRPVLSFLHPDDREQTTRSRAVLLTGRPLLNFQNRYCNSKGETVWLEWTSIFQPESQTVFAIAKNITLRKLTELDLQEKFQTLQELTLQFKQQNEWERQQLAGKLHEDLGQVAASIKVKMEWLSGQEHGLAPQLSNLLQQAVSSTNQMVHTIRKISYTLNPANVQALGLHNSMQLLCSEFTSNTGIHCAYRGRIREQRFEESVKLNLYRFCQDSLQLDWVTAGTTRVHVSLQQTVRGTKLTIEGNGIALEKDSRFNQAIRSLEARAFSIKARFTLQDKSGGTVISLLLP